MGQKLGGALCRRKTNGYQGKDRIASGRIETDANSDQNDKCSNELRPGKAI